MPPPTRSTTAPGSSGCSSRPHRTHAQNESASARVSTSARRSAALAVATAGPRGASKLVVRDVVDEVGAAVAGDLRADLSVAVQVDQRLDARSSDDVVVGTAAFVLVAPAVVVAVARPAEGDTAAGQDA